MAENNPPNPTPPPPPPVTPPHEETYSSTLAPQPELAVTEKTELTDAPEPATDTKGNPSQEEEEEEDVVAAESEPSKEEHQQNLVSFKVDVESEQHQHNQNKIPQNLGSFKEESNRVTDLSDFERTSLQQFKNLLTQDQQESVSIYGVPLLEDERTDTILLKFLRARDFKPKESHTMLKNTLQWRKSFNIDALLDEDLGDDLDKVVFMHGFSRDGHPVCYNVYGEFQNKELYDKTFGSEEKRERFLRWRVQFLEKSIRKLDFTPGGVNTLFQVNDLKNSPGPAKKELRVATKMALQLLQDNYPEFVAKQVFINVPWWYLAFYTMLNPFLTQRTKSKFVFTGPSKSPDTLFKYITPEQVPVQYGGLSVDFCDCNPDFSINDPTTEIPVKPSTKQTVEIAIYEKCIIVWELRVVGWEVSYSAEFKPDDKDAYAVIIQKATKMTPTDEPVVSNSFKVAELGKLFLTVDNPTVKKKRLLYRFKIKPYSD